MPLPRLVKTGGLPKYKSLTLKVDKGNTDRNLQLTGEVIFPREYCRVVAHGTQRQRLLYPSML